MSSVLRAMYDELDEVLLAGDFARGNAMLRHVPVERTPLPLLIGYLTITLPWREHLPERGPLVQRSRRVALRQLPPARVARLFQGLE